MRRQQVHRLPGMRDLTERAYTRTARAMEALRGFLGAHGYSVLDTPLLEETELFIRKSGGELTSRLYTFTDPGGHKVSLRPEFTSSVIRYFIQERESISLPARWQYGGPVFRYEPGDNGSYRQFNQVGAELVGAAGTEADAEILYLAWMGLQQLGLRGFRLHLAHLGVVHSLLDSYGLSEAARHFVIGNIQAFKSGSTDVASLRRRAERLGLLRAGPELDSGDAVRTMDRAGAEELVQGVLREVMPGHVGRRTPEEIVARLLRKVREANDPERLEEALALVSELARVQGQPAEAIGAARGIAAARGARASAFDELDRLLEALAARGVDEAHLVMDFGLARGLSYYTGAIFELMLASPGGAVPLGGGGRYDSLVRALGNEDDVPALGFAYNLDQVVEALASARV